MCSLNTRRVVRVWKQSATKNRGTKEMATTSPDDQANGNGLRNGLPKHLNWSTIPVEQVADGIQRQMFVGTRMMICRFRFKPFLVTPEHDHPHEQMTIVERGRVRFFVEG